MHNPGDSERVPVMLDVSLPNMGCEFVGLDIQDDLGAAVVLIIYDTVQDKAQFG